MHADLLTSLLAAGLTAVCAGPQMLRALRATAGLSAAAGLQAFVLGSVWAAYGLSTGAWVLLVSEGLFAAGGLTIVLRLLPRRQVAAWTVGSYITIGLAFVTVGPGWCLVAAALSSVSVRLVQIRTILRAGSASGVSTLTWWLLATSNFAWAATGALRSDPFFAWAAAAGGLCSLAVIVSCTVVARRETSQPYVSGDRG